MRAAVCTDLTTCGAASNLIMCPNDRLRACTVVDGQPALELGSLEDIRSATKGGMDPSGAVAAHLDRLLRMHVVVKPA